MVVCHGEESGIAIVFPVGNTVADHEALEVRGPCSWGLLVSIIDPLIDSKGKLGNVDAGI